MTQNFDTGEGEVLIEIQRVGNAVKVRAMDPVTLTEITIVGSPHDTEETLTRTAVQKLVYVLNKKGLRKS
ncbi:MAG: hypothetical protein J4G10_02840 [Alphaproteobacteria bacterium]|nr:hypothetical protein [Alphaproteobacteria bacterium]